MDKKERLVAGNTAWHTELGRTCNNWKQLCFAKGGKKRYNKGIRQILYRRRDIAPFGNRSKCGIEHYTRLRSGGEENCCDARCTAGNSEMQQSEMHYKQRTDGYSVPCSEQKPKDTEMSLLR